MVPSSVKIKYVFNVLRPRFNGTWGEGPERDSKKKRLMKEGVKFDASGKVLQECIHTFSSKNSNQTKKQNKITSYFK